MDTDRNTDTEEGSTQIGRKMSSAEKWQVVKGGMDEETHRYKCTGK